MDALTLSLWAGMALHTTGLDSPEVNNLDNPVGIVQLDLNFNEDLKLFCKHESSIPRMEVGYGFNECGMMFKVK